MRHEAEPSWRGQFAGISIHFIMGADGKQENCFGAVVLHELEDDERGRLNEHAFHDSISRMISSTVAGLAAPLPN